MGSRLTKVGHCGTGHFFARPLQIECFATSHDVAATAATTGSATTQINTTGREEDGHYICNGQKAWIWRVPRDSR